MDDRDYPVVEGALLHSMLGIIKSLAAVLPASDPAAQQKKSDLDKIEVLARNLVIENVKAMEMRVPKGWRPGGGAEPDELEECPNNCGHRRKP